MEMFRIRSDSRLHCLSRSLVSCWEQMLYHVNTGQGAS